MNAEAYTWPKDLIYLCPSSLDVSTIAADIYARTCRTDFDAPGFFMVNVGSSMESVAFRRLMVMLKRAMAVIHEANTGKTLVYQSAMRFDQQETTRPHLDGGPEESLLMLGYEPSEVDAELEILDYSKCAHDLGLAPDEFMARHNPMFKPGYNLLRPYSTRIGCGSQSDFQMLCVNNSSAPFLQDKPMWQGTLHRVKILTPNAVKRRIVNSTMIASAPLDTADTITAAQQQVFITTPTVHRKGDVNPPHKDDPQQRL